MRFEKIEYLPFLLLVALPVLLFFFLLRWKKKTRSRIGDPALVSQLVQRFSPFRFQVKFILLVLSFIAIIIGAANLQKPGGVENVNRRGVDVMFVLDVSKSMLAEDIKPSRLEKAKQLLDRLSDKLDNDRLGLVLFAGRSYLQMPLTTDHGATKMYVRNSNPDVVPTQGTVIGEALTLANTSFNSKERKYKAIVLISDGEDHDPDALKVAKNLADSGVMINTVGIGSPEGSIIIDPATHEEKKDEQGKTVISKLNEAELQQLADATNGRYLRLDNMDDAVITLQQQLDSIEKKSLTDSQFVDFDSYFQWFLGAAILFLLIEFFLSERKNIRSSGSSASSAVSSPSPRSSGSSRSSASSRSSGSSLSSAPSLSLAIGIGIAGLLAALPTDSFAQSENALIRSGNRYYKQKQIDQSQQQYEQALHDAPDNPTAHYNMGNTQFRKNNYDDAIRSYDATIEKTSDKALKEKGYYNKAVALGKQQKLDESIEAYKNALKLNPSDKDARENLEKALLEQKEKKKQEQEQKDKQDQKNKQDQKDKKDKKDQPKKQDQKDQKDKPDQPKPPTSKLNKQQVEQLLQALQQREKEVQEKMNQNKVKSLTQPDKDW